MMKIVSPDGHNFTVDGDPLSPRASQKVHNHSPDGFSCGYEGSGPAQLALAIALLKVGPVAAAACHQDLKRDIVATWPGDGPVEAEFDWDEWYRLWKAMQKTDTPGQGRHDGHERGE